jgi:hypothetical protein
LSWKRAQITFNNISIISEYTNCLQITETLPMPMPMPIDAVLLLYI